MVIVTEVSYPKKMFFDTTQRTNFPLALKTMQQLIYFFIWRDFGFVCQYKPQSCIIPVGKLIIAFLQFCLRILITLKTLSHLPEANYIIRKTIPWTVCNIDHMNSSRSIQILSTIHFFELSNKYIRSHGELVHTNACYFRFNFSFFIILHSY